MGRPRKYERSDKDAALVATLASLGYAAEDIIDALGMDISRRTLERHYKTELRATRLKVIASLGSMLHGEAIKEKSIGAANTWLHWFGDKPVREREEKSGKLTLADLMRDAPE